MKVLRILVITTCLNVSFAHAMEEVSLGSQLITATGKAILTTAGIFITAEGVCTAQSGKSVFLPLPTISNNKHVDYAGKAAVGLFETGVGLTAIAYAFK